MKEKFKLPPCSINPETEKPYTRHKWMIQEGKLVQKSGSPLLYYHVVCARTMCKLNSPNPIAY